MSWNENTHRVCACACVYTYIVWYFRHCSNGKCIYMLCVLSIEWNIIFSVILRTVYLAWNRSYYFCLWVNFHLAYSKYSSLANSRTHTLQSHANRFLCKNQKRFLIFRIHHVVFVGFNLFCVSIEKLFENNHFHSPRNHILSIFLFLSLCSFLFYPASRPYIIRYAPFIRTNSANMFNFACQRLDMSESVCVSIANKAHDFNRTRHHHYASFPSKFPNSTFNWCWQAEVKVYYIFRFHSLHKNANILSNFTAAKQRVCALCAQTHNRMHTFQTRRSETQEKWIETSKNIPKHI